MRRQKHFKFQKFHAHPMPPVRVELRVEVVPQEEATPPPPAPAPFGRGLTLLSPEEEDRLWEEEQAKKAAERKARLAENLENLEHWIRFFQRCPHLPPEMRDSLREAVWDRAWLKAELGRGPTPRESREQYLRRLRAEDLKEYYNGYGL